MFFSLIVLNINIKHINVNERSGKNGPVAKAGGIKIAKKTIIPKKIFLDFEIIEHI